MSHMETIQGKIEITRQQIIQQLQDEISQFQLELGSLSADGERGVERRGKQVYQRGIERKRQLISNLR